MKQFFFTFLVCIMNFEVSYAEKLGLGVSPTNSITQGSGTSWGLIEVLQFAESFLLKVVLPIVIIGSALYIAYELFLAEGNEEKVKQAWKSLTFASIGVVCIAMGYAIIAIVTRLSL